MKFNFILLFLFLGFGMQAQNLEQYIPRDADVVAEMSGDQIFSLINKSEVEKLMSGGDSDAPPMDLDQYGIDVNSKAYYFYKQIDSMTYNTVVVKLADAAKAQELVQSMLGPESTKVKGFNWIAQPTMAAGWNKDMAIFTMASVPKVKYTMEDLLNEKQEMLDENPDYDSDMEEQSDEDLEQELMIKNIYAPNIYSDELVAQKMQSFFTGIVGSKMSNSVLKAPYYKSGKMKNSSAYFWVKDVDAILSKVTSDDMMTAMVSQLKDLPAMKLGINALSGNLLFNKDEVNMKLDMSLDSKISDSYKKIYNNKLDRSFVRYFNPDEVLSYMSVSFDMEELLKENGEMMKNLYEPMLNQMGFKEEADIAVDMLEMILDEEAIGEFITGDAVMVLHDVDTKEVTYKTNEWDENFNATEVEKTKEEMIPTFTFMLGSENKKMVNKLLRLGSKYGFGENEANYKRFAVQEMGVPFDLYLTQQDGIIFVTNSTENIVKYANRKRKCSFGKHKRKLRKRPFSLYVNAAEGMKKAAKLLPGDVSKMDHLTESFKEFFITMSPIKDGKMTYDITMKTDDSKDNSLKVIFDALTAE